MLIKTEDPMNMKGQIQKSLLWRRQTIYQLSNKLLWNYNHMMAKKGKKSCIYG
jgi:hypothetical protein